MTQNQTTPETLSHEILNRRDAIAADPIRMSDAEFVLRWVYQSGPEIVPSHIYDIAAKALDFPSLAHGCSEENRQATEDTERDDTY